MHTPIADNIDRWIEELSNGGHRQNRRGYLLTGGCYCCLGVAAAKVLEMERETVVRNKNKKPITVVSFECETATLTTYEQLGLWDESGTQAPGWYLEALRNGTFKYSCPSSWDQASLAGLNDAGVYCRMGEARKIDFAWIADHLLVDLRTGLFGVFTPDARREWCAKHGMTP